MKIEISIEAVSLEKAQELINKRFETLSPVLLPPSGSLSAGLGDDQNHGYINITIKNKEEERKWKQ